jgi:mono/diheme cytochrome c family protein
MKPITKITAIFSVLMLFCLCLKAQVKHKVVHHRYSLTLSIANGKKVYMQTCVSCHQVDGGGVQNMNPPLIKTDYVLGDKIRLVKIVLNGFNENADINGQTYSNNMPSHDFLTDRQIADVLTYVRNSFTNKAPAITMTQVKVIRATNKKS